MSRFGIRFGEGFARTKDSTAGNRDIEIRAARRSLKEVICSNFETMKRRRR